MSSPGFSPGWSIIVACIDEPSWVPSAIEAKFKALCPYASQFMVFGNDRNFVVANIAAPSGLRASDDAAATEAEGEATEAATAE